MSEKQSFSASYSWNSRPFLTKEQVAKITKNATWFQKFRLFFKPSHYSIDGKAVIRYKQMDGIIFVMKRGTKI